MFTLRSLDNILWPGRGIVTGRRQREPLGDGKVLFLILGAAYTQVQVSPVHKNPLSYTHLWHMHFSVCVASFNKMCKKKKNPPYERVGGAMRKALLGTLRLGSWGKFPREGDAGLVFPGIPALALGMDSGRHWVRAEMQKQTWGARSSLSAGEPYRSVREEQWPGERGCFWLVFVREALLPAAHQCGCGRRSWGGCGYICVLESSLRQEGSGWVAPGRTERTFCVVQAWGVNSRVLGMENREH